jgi:scyllo-inositol 2-dehydrogenase (NADP+)
MKPIKTAVIGYGFAGRAFHAYLVGLAPGLELFGIASRNPETQQKIRERGDCRVFTSFDEVLQNPEVELVVIATPNDVHCEYSIRALEAGKHVVTDKPMCLSVEECDRMIAAQQKSGSLLSVFHNRRWDGDFLTAQQLMNDGALGDVRWMELAWQNFGPPGGWRGQAEKGGGRLLDLGAHMLDQLLLLFPERVTSVYARIGHDFDERDVESTAMMILGFESGRTGVIDASSLSAIRKPRFALYGTQATWVKYGLDPQETCMKEGDIDAAREDLNLFGKWNNGREEKTVPTIAGRWRSFYENIADAIQGKAELAVQPLQVRRAMQVFEAAWQSAETGEAVKVDVPALSEI